jgi:hypothetical protein
MASERKLFLWFFWDYFTGEPTDRRCADYQPLMRFAPLFSSVVLSNF